MSVYHLRACVCGMEYHNIDGTGWPDAVVVDNGRSVLDPAYETRPYFPVDLNALLALTKELDSLCGPWGDCGKHYAPLIRKALRVES